MPRSDLTTARARLGACGPDAALAFLVLGARLWAFAYAGSPLPLYDQWTAEFHNTFLKIAQGSSLGSVLLWPHNEHILATTKVVTIAGFALNGYWDVDFLVVAFAIARALEAVLLFRLFAEPRNRARRFGAWIACAVVFATPISGYNLLCGLQICFTFAELCLIASLFVVQRWSTPGRSSLRLIGSSLLGLASVGSAIAIPVATLVAHVARPRRRPGFRAAWAVTMLAALAYAARFGHGAGSLPTSVSPGDRVLFALRLFSWPVGNAALGALILAGLLLLMGAVGRRPQGNERTVAPLLGVCAFALINALMLAANRAPAEFHMRHWDVMALIPLSVVLIAFTLARKARRGRSVAAAGAGALAILYLGALVTQAWRPSWRYLEAGRAHRAEALAYYRGLLTSSRLVDEVTGASPTLDTQGQFFFDDPILRYTPHRGVYASIMRAPLPALSLLGPDILPTRPPTRLTRALHRLIRYGWMWVAAAALIAAGTASKTNSATPASGLQERRSRR